ncbi:MAG TPA: phospholipase D family protein [Pirellulales bacterium]|jgi:phosphatidylserine/phosphatidylglycerophosphate/cardiolipin synthase-like enzyme|nr:phospholipase D family protein [Pirellulales bacterium]
MTYSSSSSRQPFLFAAAVLMALAFAIGYAAGTGGVNLGSALSPEGAPAASEDGITVNFSPKGGCTERVVEEIEKAQQVIEMQAYSFTSEPITQALIDAHHRGVKITIVLDKSDLKDNSEQNAAQVAADRIPTYIDAKHSIAHNKIILIDGQTIITGSFNFTNQAEHSNAENLLVIHGRPKLYAGYDANFRLHLGHSEPFSASMAHEPSNERSFR